MSNIIPRSLITYMENINNNYQKYLSLYKKYKINNIHQSKSQIKQNKDKNDKTQDKSVILEGQKSKSVKIKRKKSKPKKNSNLAKSKKAKNKKEDKIIKKKSKSRKKKGHKEKIKNDEKRDEKRDLYSLLGLNKSASMEDIRNSYKHLVFLCHPDKNKKDPNTSEKFINIHKAYQILSNPKSRKYYDETGEYENNDGEINIDDTYNYFRNIYSTKEIDQFKNNYINSKEEKEDLINFYNEYKGDMTNILECIPYSTNSDIERYIKIYEDLFEKKVLEKTKKYEKTANKIKFLKIDKKEEEEANELLNNIIQKQIINNRKRRNYNDYLENLAKENKE